MLVSRAALLTFSCWLAPHFLCYLPQVSAQKSSSRVSSLHFKVVGGSGGFSARDLRLSHNSELEVRLQRKPKQQLLGWRRSLFWTKPSRTDEMCLERNQNLQRPLGCCHPSPPHGFSLHLRDGIGSDPALLGRQRASGSDCCRLCSLDKFWNGVFDRWLGGGGASVTVEDEEGKGKAFFTV
ncbi:hypothetical protein FQA47_003605 [Oryzias melastigma]|uniref:Uncharacterized protein n=1 Tax=Oryzias melastigma TaxID=30732 RepID=A0A834CC84_ORYME|nr:hypothetical protein FQA47_003605 [Oryzias melastigma]